MFNLLGIGQCIGMLWFLERFLCFVEGVVNMVLMLSGVKSATPCWMRTIDVLADCSASCTIGLTHNREKICVPDVE